VLHQHEEMGCSSVSPTVAFVPIGVPKQLARDTIKSALSTFPLRTVVCVCYFYSKSTPNKLEHMTYRHEGDNYSCMF
jgi:hypothetical protein